MAIAEGEGSRGGGGRSWKQGVKKRVRVSRLVYGRGEDKAITGIFYMTQGFSNTNSHNWPMCLTFRQSGQHLRLREVKCKMSKTTTSEVATFQKSGG